MFFVSDRKDTQRQREGENVKTETVIGAMLPHPRKLGAARNWKRKGRILP